MSDHRKGMDTQRGTNPPNRDVNAAQRAVLAIKLRASKMTYDQIARQVGYSNASVCRKAIMREMNRVIVSNVEELRNEEQALLDQMQGECYALFMDRKNTYRLYAADRLLAISKRRSEVMGLDSRPDEQVAQQNYTKRIILTHQSSIGGQNDGASD